MGISIKKEHPDLVSSLRRPEGAARLLGLSQVALEKGLSHPADELDKTLSPLAEIAAKLPDRTLSPSEKANARRVATHEDAGVSRNFAHAIRRLQAHGESVSSPNSPLSRLPDPKRLEGLADRTQGYLGIVRYAAQAIDGAMDLRLILGAWQFFVLQQVLTFVVGKLEDDSVSAQEKSKLNLAFGPLLAHKEEFLAQSADRAEARKVRSDEDKEEAEQADRRNRMLDTLYAIRRGVDVDEETLEDAAVTYAEIAQRRKTKRS